MCAKLPLTPSLLVAHVCAFFLGSVSAADYYVATDGNDGNSGSLISPFATVQMALDKVAAGDVIHVREGIYREAVYFSETGTAAAPITLKNYNDEPVCLKGSDLVDGWVLHEAGKNIWKRTNWTINSQQVFVHTGPDIDPGDDGMPLRQIGPINSVFNPSYYVSPFKDMVINEADDPGATPSGVEYAGAFQYSDAENTLYIRLNDGLNPNSLLVEVSTRNRILLYRQLDQRIMPHGHHYKVAGIRFSHSNSTHKTTTSGNSPVWFGANTVVSDCEFAWLDFNGCLIGSGSVCEGSTMRNNGCTGASGSVDFEFRNCRFLANNEREFSPFWHAGGIKVVADAWGKVLACEVGNNHAPGIWYDGCKSGNQCLIEGNYIYNNYKESGIMYEISTNGIIANNIVAGTARRGIYISDSNQTLVYNNTVIGTTNLGGNRSAIELVGSDRSGSDGLYGNRVFNNIVAYTQTSHDLLVSDNAWSYDNTIDHNCYHRIGGGVKLRHGAFVATDLSAWQAQTSWDQNSLEEDPLFLIQTGPSPPFQEDQVTAGHRLRPTSPCIDVGDDVGAVLATDFDGNPRVVNGEPDMGALESNGGYVLWASAITNGLTGHSDSATGDGVPNIVKYANGSSATLAAPQAALSLLDNAGLQQLTFNRNRNALDVVIEVEASTGLAGASWEVIATCQLGSWTPANVITESGTGPSASADVKDPGAGSARRFYRLRVTSF